MTPPGPAGGCGADSPGDLSGFADRLGHRFADPGLLTQAVTHRSWCAEHPGVPSNERLEFLGDAVLGVVVTDHLYRTYPDLAEGQLAKARAGVVSAAALAAVAADLGLGEVVRLGRGEENSGGRTKGSILADALEAVLGAVWLDAGHGVAAGLIIGLLSGRMQQEAAGPGVQDFKTRLQEHAARISDALPVYGLTETGPDHAKQFTATVRIAGELWGTGTGRSKKEAEQHAAADALARIGSQGGGQRAEGGQRTNA